MKLFGKFFNTTGLDESEVNEKKDKNNRQEMKILRYLLKNKSASASEMFKANVLDGNVPITSYRRSLSNLVSNGLAVKTERKVVGLFGSCESVYERVG